MALRRSVLSYLEDDAARHSGRCAVIDEGGSCTYGQLYLRARKVGSALAELGARHRAVVVYMEKGIDALSVMFGALCAGGFYVPWIRKCPLSDWRASSGSCRSARCCR